MGENSKIQWTDHTLNLWWGCVEVSPGCDHCYAKSHAERFGRKVWGVDAPRFFTKNPLAKLDKWNREAEKAGERRRVFVQSMSDICEVLPEAHPNRQQMDDVRAEFFAGVSTWPMLEFQLLTKRVGNYRKVVPGLWMQGFWPANVWAGISVVNQAEADRDIPKLLAIPAPVRFLSVEPQVERITLREEWAALSLLIQGGESGGKARPFNLDWAYVLRDQCAYLSVAYFLKQLGRRPVGMSLKDSHGGDWSEWPEGLRVREFPEWVEPNEAPRETKEAR